MTKTLKALSALLSYPVAELKAATDALEAVIMGEGILPPHAAGPVLELIDDIAACDLYDLQERYVLLFDRTRSLSLHLFEHVHGEGRDRGQALVDLMTLYERHGLVISARELPDYLPLYLEFLSTRPLSEAKALLAQPRHILLALAERLERRKSHYAGVFHALVALAKPTLETGTVEPLPQEKDDDPNDLAALDRAWEDEPVTFGPGPQGAQGDCRRASDMLKRMTTGLAASPPATQARARGGSSANG